MYYVAVDVGCLECGEFTHVLGIFTSKSKAEDVCEEHKKRQKNNWSGQHDFEVFEIEKIDEIYSVDY